MVKRNFTLLCIVLGFLIHISSSKAVEKNIDIFITGNMGEIYFPVDGKHPEVTESLENTLSELRIKNPSAIFIDTGDFSRPAFFNETSYSASPVRMFKELKYDAVTLGENEMILGKEFVTKWHNYLGSSLISNLLEQQKQHYIVSPSRIIKRDDLKIGIIAVTDRILKGFLRNSLTPPLNIVKDVQKHISELKKQTNFIILISGIDEKNLKSILSLQKVPLIICTGRAKDKKSTTYEVNQSLVCKRFAPYSIGRLRIRYDTQKDRITKYKYKEYRIKFKKFNVWKYKPWVFERKTPPAVPQSWRPYLPGIGLQIKDITRLKHYGLKAEVKEIISADISPPRVLKSNKKVYAYLLKHNGQAGDTLYLCRYNTGFGGVVFSFYIVFSPDGTVKFLRALHPASLGGNILDMDKYYASLLDKKVPDWQPPAPVDGLAGFYQDLFVNLVYAVDEINNAMKQEFP